MEKRIIIENQFNEKINVLRGETDYAQAQKKIVLLVHGFGVDLHEKGAFDDLVDVLIENGFITYRFDFSGSGKSEGDYSKTTLTKQKDELQLVLNYIEEKESVDLRSIALLAQSFGTSVAIALNPDVKCLILTGAINEPRKEFERLFGDGFNPEGISIRKGRSGSVKKLERKFWTDLEEYDIERLIKEIKKPLLFMHGGDDDLIPISSMEELYSIANEPKEKIVIENANHNMEPNRKDYCDSILSYIKKTL